MAKIKAKQIDKLIGTRKRVNSAVTVLTGTSAYVTTPSFAGSAAGGSDSVAGVITTAPNNLVEFRRRLNGRELVNAGGLRIFGRTTHAASVFTTRLYVSDGAGGETEYAPVAGDALNNVVVDMIFVEVVQFSSLLPSQTINGLDSVDEGSSDPNSHQRQIDVFGGVTNGQTAFVLTQAPKAGSVELSINGQAQVPGTDFTMAGANLTYAAVDFAIEATDKVVATYDR